jgi:hypothetical protein
VLDVTVVRLRVVWREFGFLRFGVRGLLVLLRGGCRSFRYHAGRAGALRCFGSWNLRLWNDLRLRSRVGFRRFGDRLRMVNRGRRWRIILRRRIQPRLRTSVIGVRSMLVRFGRLSAAAADRHREGESQQEKACVLHGTADARRARALQLRTLPGSMETGGQSTSRPQTTDLALTSSLFRRGHDPTRFTLPFARAPEYVGLHEQRQRRKPYRRTPREVQLPNEVGSPREGGAASNARASARRWQAGLRGGRLAAALGGGLQQMWVRSWGRCARALRPSVVDGERHNSGNHSGRGH